MTTTFTPSVQDFGTAVSLGVIRNTNGNPYIRRSVYGLNPAVGAGTQGLWSVGGLFNFLTAPEPVRIAAGGDAADAAGGLGVQSVRVFGLDENQLRAEEVIVTNGIAASLPTTTTFWRVWEVRALDVGVYGGANVADLDIESANTSTTLLRMQEGIGESQHGNYAVPIDHTALIHNTTGYIERGAEVTFLVRVRPNFADAVTPPFSATRVAREVAKVPQGVWGVDTRSPGRVLGGSDIYIEVFTETGQQSLVSASLEIILIPNT